MANLDLKSLLTYKSKEFLSSNSWQRVIAPIHKSVLNQLIQKYQSDKWVKTLFTHNIIKLYLFIGLAMGKTVTLRAIETISKSGFVQCFSGLSNGVSRSGLSDRNEVIPAGLFEELVWYLAGQATKKEKKLIKQAKNQIKIFDTTFISLAHKLIPWACQSVNKGLTSLAIRIDQGSWIPDKIFLKNEPSDHQVFADLIDWTLKGITYLFDRGFSNFEVLLRIIESGNFFITRLPAGYVYQVIKDLKCTQAIGKNIRILSDQIIMVGGQTRKKKFKARLITAVNTNGEVFRFLTNRFDLTTSEVCEIYRLRWEIELLFRWLKVQLKMNQLISYTENGFYVQIYMALIVHILIVIYHHQNRSDQSPLETQRRIKNELPDSWGYLMFLLGVKLKRVVPFSTLILICQQKGILCG